MLKKLMPANILVSCSLFFWIWFLVIGPTCVPLWEPGRERGIKNREKDLKVAGTACVCGCIRMWAGIKQCYVDINCLTNTVYKSLASWERDPSRAKEIFTGAPLVFDFCARVIGLHLINSPEIMSMQGWITQLLVDSWLEKMELAQSKMARICGHKEKNKMGIYTTNVGSEGFAVQSFL